MVNAWEDQRDHYQRKRVGVTYGYTTKVDNSKKRQRVKAKGIGGTENEFIETILPAGIASNPGAGEKSEMILLDTRADATHRYAILTGDREYHLQVDEGQVALYSPDNSDHKITIDKDGAIEVFGMNLKITSDVEIIGNLSVDGDIITSGDITSAGFINDSDGDPSGGGA